MRRCYLFIFFLIIITACSKSKGDEPNPIEIAQINVTKNVVKGYELVTVDVEGYTLSSNTYELEIGPKKIKAIKSPIANALDFIVPGDLVTGTYTLKAEFAKNTIQLSVIAPAKIQNPDKYISDLSQRAKQESQALSLSYDERVQAGLLSKSEAENLKSIAIEAADAIASYSAELSAEEKIIYTQMIEANRHWLESYKNKIQQNPFIQFRTIDEPVIDPCASTRAKLNATPAWKKYDRDYLQMQLNHCMANGMEKRLDATNGYLARLKAAYLAASEEYINTPGFMSASKAFFKTFFSEAKTGIWEEFKRVNNLSDTAFGVESLDDAFSERRAALEYYTGQAYDIGARISVTNLSKDEVKLKGRMLELKKKVDAYNESLEVLKSLVSVVPLIKLPEYRNEILTVSGFTIDNISPEKVKATVVPGGKGKLVKFTASGTAGERISFTYRIKVDTPYGNVEKVISAILVVQPSIITVAGGNSSGNSPVQLDYPMGVHVDHEGNVYVADMANARVQKWAKGANTGVTVAGGNGLGRNANQLKFPTDIHVDQAGNIYIADGDRVQRWAPGANSGVTVAGGNGTSEAANSFGAKGIYVDRIGNIYIADADNARVQKWAPGAKSGVTVVNKEMQEGSIYAFSIDDVYVDDSGNIYVSNSQNERVQKWAPGAKSGVTVAGGNGRGSNLNQLASPDGIYVDAKGNVYVADVSNNRVQKWAPGAKSGVTVAGGNGDGNAKNQLSLPSNVFVDEVDNIYVVDSGNNRVQKWVQ